MTVPSEIKRSGPFFGDNVATAFDYKFKIVDRTHIAVIRTENGEDTTLVIDEDYTVTDVGNEAGGQVITVVAPTSQQSITNLRNVPFTQETDLENQGGYYPETVEKAFDLSVMRDQQLSERLDRSLQIPASSNPSDLDTLVADILRLKESADNIDIVAAIDDDVQAVAANNADISAVADNIVDVTNFAAVYYGPRASDPTARNDGTARQEGDLYFNTTVKQLRIFDGAAWQAITDQALNISVKSFVGDGVTTAFTLDTSPGTVNNLLVEIGGVLQVPTIDFTVSGTTLTIAPAVANGDTINTWVIATTAVLNVPADNSVTLASLSDALVQDDTEPRNDAADNQLPTVKRVATMIADLSPSLFITPEDYGCVGNDVDDDTVNFEAALDAAIAAGVVLLLGQNKTYLLNTWPAAGYYPSGNVFIKGLDRTSKIKGPAGASYFVRPGTAFAISEVAFDRWAGIVCRDVADGGSIVGARFCDNKITNITGIPYNIEIEHKDSYVTGNSLSDCSGGYGIRIGENTYANQNKWDNNIIADNVLRNFTATGTVSGFPIIIYGKNSIVSNNTIDGLLSADGEAVGIYVKLRNSQITNNKVRNINATGSSGAALDVAGISLKGAPRNITNSGVQGFKNICAGNVLENIGNQMSKGSGIRCQNSHCVVANNQVIDAGSVGISMDDSNGSSYNKFIGNTIEGFNKLGNIGLHISTFGNGNKLIGNTVKDFIYGAMIECGSNSLLSTLVEGNSIETTRASSFGFGFKGGGNIAGVMISANDVNLPASGYIVLNNNTVSRVNLRNNDFTPAISSGAGTVLGSATGITFTANP